MEPRGKSAMSTDFRDRVDGPEERPAEETPEGLAARWIDAWNWREADVLVELADPGIVLQPLRLRGLAEVYHGPEGVREWMRAIQGEGHDHRLSPQSLKVLDSRRVLAVGTVRIGADVTSPFSGLYEHRGGRITFMSHYFTPPSVLESIGVLEPGAAG